jgi:hypothetical protein
LELQGSDQLEQQRVGRISSLASMTGARVAALASFLLGHVDLAGSFVDLAGSFIEQDARTVATKFAKSFRTWCMPVSERTPDIVRRWIGELKDEHLCGPSAPQFPATAIALGEGGGFTPIGLARHG